LLGALRQHAGFVWLAEEVQWSLGCEVQFIQKLKFIFNFAARYGAPLSLADYARKAAAAVHEGHRAFFDGYSKNKYVD
jgi:hypothetical protein